MSCLDNRNLCMRGTCEEVNTTGGSVIGRCVCDEGWQNDNALFHQDNCGIPANALLAIFIVYGIGLTLPFFALFIRATLRAKGRMRKTGTIVATICLTFTAATLSLYLENGIFEATSILLNVTLAVTNYIAENVLMMMLAPIVAVRHRHLDPSVPRKLHRFMWVIRSLYVALGIAEAAICRTNYFNDFALALLLMTVVTAVISSVFQLRYIAMLREAIKSTLLNSSAAVTHEEGPYKITELMVRLKKTRNGLYVYCSLVAVLQFSVVGIYFGLGQALPFAWCLWPLLFLGQFIKYYQCLVLFQNSSSNGSDTKGATAVNSRRIKEAVVVSLAPAASETVG